MASLYLYDAGGAITWKITGLGVAFNSSNYTRAGISSEPVAYGTPWSDVSAAGIVLDYVNAPASGTSTTVTDTISSDPGGPWTIYGWAMDRANGYCYPAGSDTITVADSRPDNWAWYNTIAQGQPVNVSASEWNAFCSRINDFRSYMGISDYSFTTVSTGSSISAAIVNQARSAISAMSPVIAVPAAAVSGVTAISAYFFNQLMNSLNSID